MPPSSRRRRRTSFWLVIVPAWAISIVLGIAWVWIGVFWSVDSWQATHEGIRGSFIPQVEECGPKDCHWYGDFLSEDGMHDVFDVKFSSGFGEPQPQATGEVVEPVVIAPGGTDVYNPHDKTWAFAWIMAAVAPFVTWAMIARVNEARAAWPRKGDDERSEHQRLDAS